MTIIYRKTDLIKLKIGDLVFGIKPLSYQERIDVMTSLSNESGTVVENAALATFKIMKKSIRTFTGAFLPNGEPYKIEYDKHNDISDESIDDLLNLEENEKLSKALYNFLKGVPAKLVDPNTQKEIKGVEIVPQSNGLPKK